MAVLLALLQQANILLTRLLVLFNQKGTKILSWTLTSSFAYFSIMALAIITVIRFYVQLKNIEKLNKQERLNETDEKKYTVIDLTWFNAITTWMYASSGSTYPMSFLNNVNFQLDNQKNDFQVVLQDYREGSMLPIIKKIRNINSTKENIQCDMLLDLTDFGFLMLVIEYLDCKPVSSLHSAILTQVECWMSAFLYKENKDIILKLTFVDSRPKFRFRLKPSDQHLVLTQNESVSEAIKEAILSTPICVNISQLFQWNTKVANGKIPIYTDLPQQDSECFIFKAPDQANSTENQDFHCSKNFSTHSPVIIKKVPEANSEITDLTCKKSLRTSTSQTFNNTASEEEKSMLSSGSVAENALKDLSFQSDKQQKVTKTKIIITSVKQANNNSFNSLSTTPVINSRNGTEIKEQSLKKVSSFSTVSPNHAAHLPNRKKTKSLTNLFSKFRQSKKYKNSTFNLRKFQISEKK